MYEEEQKRSAVGVLAEIWEILEKNADLIPQSANIKKTARRIQAHPHPDKILKRIRGIIKGFNSENAERKLKNLAAMLDSMGTPKEN